MPISYKLYDRFFRWYRSRKYERQCVRGDIDGIKKICPRCRTTYPNISKIEYCVCGHKFGLTFADLRKVSEDLLGEDVFKGFDIREGLDRK